MTGLDPEGRMAGAEALQHGYMFLRALQAGDDDPQAVHELACLSFDVALEQGPGLGRQLKQVLIEASYNFV